MEIQDRYQCKKILFYIEDVCSGGSAEESEERGSRGVYIEERGQACSRDRYKELMQQVSVCAEKMTAYGAEVVICQHASDRRLKDFVKLCEGVTGDIEKNKTLLVTDSLPVIKALQNRGVPVLVVLHDGNREVTYPGVKYYIEGFEDVGYGYFDRVYCRALRLPWTVMDTERLRIREQTVEDVEELYRIYQHPEITRYMENLFPEIEQEKHYAEDYRKYIYEFYDFGIWVLEERATGKVIGRAGIEYKEELGQDNAELGFMVEKERQGCGLAYEACRAILSYAAEQLELVRIYAFVKKENTASIQLLLKLGFQPDGGLLREEEQLLEYVLQL